MGSVGRPAPCGPFSASWAEEPGVWFLLFLWPYAFVGLSLVFVRIGVSHTEFCFAKRGGTEGDVGFGGNP